MQRVALPYTTVTAGLSVFDTDNQYRPRLWLDAPEEIDWLYKEDNGLLLTLLERFAPRQSINEPIIWYTEDERLDIHTTLTEAVSSSADTTLILADPRIAVVNTFLFSPADGELMKVTDIDYTTSTATVTRGYNGTAKVNKALGDTIISMPAHMAELSDPNEGNGRVPTTAKFNYMSVVSETFKVSRMQENSEMRDGWGQASKAMIDTMLNVRRQVGKALLFSARGTNATTNDGQEYVTQGLYHFVETGMLDLGQKNGNLTWPILNAWLEARFDPDSSSNVKELMVGLWLWKAILRMVRDTDKMLDKPYFEPQLGTQVVPITTDGGYTVNVMLDKYGLAVNEQLGAWGFLLDMANIESYNYEGLEFQWVPNIQDNRSVMYREDCFLGSFGLIAKHEQTHGIIRGASTPIVNR